MTPEAIDLLYSYTYWAFERVWDCIMPLTDAQFTQDIDYSIGSIRNHVVHMMSGTRRWMERLQGIEIAPHLPFDDYATRTAAKAQAEPAPSGQGVRARSAPVSLGVCSER